MPAALQRARALNGDFGRQKAREYKVTGKQQKAIAALIRSPTVEAAAEAKRNLSPALGILRGIVEDADQPGAVRVSAARSLMEYGLKLHDVVFVERRLDALEQALREVENE